MGHIKDIKSNLDPQAFPGATFQIEGQVPAAQCSEAKIEGEHGQTWQDQPMLFDTGAFIGWNLAGKILHIVSPPENADDITINWNADNSIYFTPLMSIDSNNNVYYITNGGELILTRNVPSFAKFIHAAGYAYTIKGGKLYTDMPSGQLKDACTILFDPLT